ncbi:hypothetical protein HS088_TW20G00142 [Tripterygium wilfordii]|uniref:Aluminum activated malate transporter family protein n=1 Tax=Tripterygium wilfordii TaxID=458696 RepID=A0A7J7C6M6_TRIWF|nr:aluminum-activated malate transporter 10-like [Tripterygium wilfordii]KAF5729778.1 hypothetical protein HS088_TW20G00142 [Tripterygium wilfordii]
MAEKQQSSSDQLEWRINVGDGSSRTLVPKAGLVRRAWQGLKGVIEAFFVKKVWRFLKKAWDLGVDDPRKFIHCLKVGIALTVVSLFYYMRPLYDGFGGNAMWAVMTVVVVFENNVGASVCKCLNRICGTSLAGFLGFGVHCLASKSGPKLEPFIVGSSVFLLASAATFSRFIPSVKARFDYGAMIFILTFSLVSVSGYRVDELLGMARERISTIIVGTSLCILVSMLICPIWAGGELHVLIHRNMEKLAISLEGCTSEFFQSNGGVDDKNKESNEKLLGFKCVLGSKANEEAMAKFALWEPAHGQFNYKHPWKQYLKIGSSIRSCAYCLEALNACINSEHKVPESIMEHVSDSCLTVSSNASRVIRELAETMKTMKRSSTIDVLLGEMNSSVQELQGNLKSLLPENGTPIMDMIPVLTCVSLLIEIANRVEAIVDAVKELSNLAAFGFKDQDKSKQDQPKSSENLVQEKEREEQTIMTLQRVSVL